MRAVSLTQLQSFVAVAEERHVGRAARRLHLTQPPLSRHILALEDELGTALFARTPRGMQLLPAGEALLAHARRILGEVDAAVASVRALGASGSADGSAQGRAEGSADGHAAPRGPAPKS
jgi:DNA-binding transcriptional LysR family regulator